MSTLTCHTIVEAHSSSSGTHRRPNVDHHQLHKSSRQQQQQHSLPINIKRSKHPARTPRSPEGVADDYFGLNVASTSSTGGESDYQVVLEDGTLQRRTVSLTTMVTGSYSSIMDYYQRYSDRSLLSPSSATTLERHYDHHESTPLLGGQRKRLDLSSDDDDDDDDNDDRHHDNNTIHRNKRKKISWRLSYAQKRVIKCSVAYMLGSLFTFVPILNQLVGGSMAASHLAATVTVFFNPAKTIGGMVEAAGYGWLFTVCALILCMISLWVNDLLLNDGRYLLSYGLTLGVWIGVSSFVIAYFKGLMNKPSTGTASALAFIIILSTLVREASPDRNDYSFTLIQHLFVLVAIGTIISIAVCLVLWPETATKKLKADIHNSLMSNRVLLKLLTKTFLLDADLPSFTANKKLQEAIKAQRAGFAAMKKSLSDAKLEFQLVDGYDEIVASLQRLERHVGGLRSSCGLQFEAMRMRNPNDSTTTTSWNVTTSDQRRKFEHELRREQSWQSNNNNNDTTIADNDEENGGGGGGELLEFIKTVRAPMKSLAYTCKQTIVQLQSQFDTMQRRPISFRLLRQNLTVAMALFEESLHHALSHMYRRSNSAELHVQLLKEVPVDNIYLVYFFVFCLLEYAKELSILVQCVENIIEPTSSSTTAMNKQSTRPMATDTDEPFAVPNNHNTLNTLHTPTPSTQRHKFSVRLWGFFSWFRQHTVRFAAKNMITAIVLSSFAFIPQTQPYFYKYRMEWTLLTVMTLLSPTMGGTNLTAVLRVLATIVGCVVAAITYTLFPAQPVVLALLSWIYSLPSFWIILYHKHGRFGQVALLAYNLVVLFCYNHRNDEMMDFDVMELAIVRCITVSLGVVFGLVVTAYIWPYSARVELRKGLSDLLIRLSWVYKHLSMTQDQREMLHHQTECQQSLIHLRDLLVHAPSEPRLKGTFPAAAYDTLLTTCQNIMDKFVSLGIVVAKRETQIHLVLLEASTEYKEMVGNSLLYFYVLASALQLKTPLPPYLPPAERARKQLMLQLQDTSLHSEGHYMIYYAYLVLMEDVIRDLDSLGKVMKDLFGALIPDNQWAEYFTRQIA
ncbi:hypothetical protein O0I10_001397 [Lichtheimia ornata]|uniref:Endocytosis-related protein n=1 Tax=Lichtheimia ornata TaxID=688661 RepID=A0AAD7Y3P3_9FUNG|nr:uncharacterized protein O0I10_001397 [Lichtheimia ornata]KAJ8663220.1 hypothetical protein O0I10_001397 [Lichtheimia ornata]